jgi:hypothetical protein
VKQLLRETDSEELSEWYAYDQRWPLPDSWFQMARICKVIMASSGNYKTLPDEKKLIPAAIGADQSRDELIAELAKLGNLGK